MSELNVPIKLIFLTAHNGWAASYSLKSVGELTYEEERIYTFMTGDMCDLTESLCEETGKFMLDELPDRVKHELLEVVQHYYPSVSSIDIEYV